MRTVGNMLGSQHQFSRVTNLNILCIPQDSDYFYNTRFCKGISHLQLEIVRHVIIQSYEKYCRVDLAYDSCDVLIVLILRLSANDQPFANKDMNLKNVIAIQKSLCSHFSGLEFMQIHESSFCLNSRFKL